MATEKSANGGELRQRNTAAAKTTTNGSAKTTPAKKGTSAAAAKDAGFPIGVLDVFRALAGIALVSTVASYAVTHGESFIWGMQVKTPWWMDYKQVERAVQGPMMLTNDELASYDGSDPSKPILLALNRTIYDVSASPAIYGPGGAYSQLAAKDASRSYITTCFDPVDDLVPYFGGVEEIYVPLWLSKKPPKEELDKIGKGDLVYGRDAMDIIDDIQKKVGRKHIKELRKEAYDTAWERVQEKVKTWEGMFEKKGYPVVGKVVGVEEEDPTKWRHLSFCDEARAQRPSMADSMMAAFKRVGKEDKMNLQMGRNMFGSNKNKKNKKKKYGKKKDGDAGSDSDDSKKKPEDGEVWDHDDNEKSTAKIEDMIKGGKWYTEGKRSVEDIINSGPYGDDPEAAKKAKKLYERSKGKGEIPEAMKDHVVPEAADE